MKKMRVCLCFDQRSRLEALRTSILSRNKERILVTIGVSSLSEHYAGTRPDQDSTNILELDNEGNAIEGIASIFIFQGQSWGNVKAIVRIFSSLEKGILNETQVILLNNDDWTHVINMLNNASEFSGGLKVQSHLLILKEEEVPFWLATQ